MPGLGNPMRDIDIADFNEYCRRIGIIQKMTAGGLTDLDIVEIESGIY